MTRETELTKRRREEHNAAPTNIDTALNETGGIKPGWVKVGEEENQLSAGPEGLHIQGGNATIQSDKEGTRLSPGGTMTTKVQSPTKFCLEMKDGSFTLHPMGHQGASSAAFPRNTFVQEAPKEARQLVKLVEVVKALKELLT